ncbi:uncharacterized protein LAESUDRAFT_268489 [Laetiporus sulphureus 93-53]|uniref:BTB domain-containing protein n=1 Tax=Laetiporus sulphureus 93-53 TaxID=1314785 RepID=A0A165H8U1_9APHY|nr:uncharacterized protein LAESUDRAFT_268489 [Laetiporus sulphureus 93-53]KZT11403.1 hypothetical protein LAESUDRAFT_268489 [Laetiporus sulphureus 93-53]
MCLLLCPSREIVIFGGDGGLIIRPRIAVASTLLSATSSGASMREKDKKRKRAPVALSPPVDIGMSEGRRISAGSPHLWSNEGQPAESGDNAFFISGTRADVRTPPPPTREEAFRLAIFRSMDVCSFVDTKFLLFTRRFDSESDTFVHELRPVFAASATLTNASPEFDKRAWIILHLETVTVTQLGRHDIPEFANKRLSAVEYGYESDSDLEDEERDWAISDSGAVEDREVRKVLEEKERQATPRAEVATKSDIEDTTMAGTGRESSILLASGNDTMSPSVTMIKPVCVGRTIFVHDMAYKTWKALIAYLYTGHIEFAPLRSCLQSAKAEGKTAAPPLYPGVKSPSCSPKSMYRLADKYDLPELKKLASENIRSQLSAENILDEVFSEFSSRYPEIYQLEVAFLVANCGHQGVKDALPNWIAAITNGQLPHTNDVLSTFISELISRRRHDSSHEVCSTNGLTFWAA